MGRILKNKLSPLRVKPGERPDYRPDLVSRVYKLHLTELLCDIKNRHVLGVPVAMVHACHQISEARATTLTGMHITFILFNIIIIIIYYFLRS